MKPLAIRSGENCKSDDDIASLVMSVAPKIMGTFRGAMRANRPEGLSVPQFRALIFLNRRKSACISEVSEYLGVALSTASKLVDGLVKRNYLERKTAEGDRRRAVVTLTASGAEELDSTSARARELMKNHLSKLTPQEQQDVASAMQALHQIFVKPAK